MIAMKTLVLGLGNELLSDDAVGLLVAGDVEKAVALPGVEVKTTQTAGFRLVELLMGYDKVIVVDAIISDRAPAGEVYWLELGDLVRPLRAVANHNIHLADALELGRKLNQPMPREVRVLAIEVEDNLTLRESVGAAATAAVPKAVGMILDELGAPPPTP